MHTKRIDPVPGDVWVSAMHPGDPDSPQALPEIEPRVLVMGHGGAAAGPASLPPADAIALARVLDLVGGRRTRKLAAALREAGELLRTQAALDAALDAAEAAAAGRSGTIRNGPERL
ncbi:hypothetical protein [Microbispora oryzae]|uniref:hypothetical protein n=1 Tax=Microbispora oryzae TaxID=2806554 RepID=UPI001AEC5139|nr:hypothetical protein [Microbispora oryzae]